MDLLIIAISAFFLILIAFVLREISFKKQLITDSNKRTKEEVKELIKELEFKLHEAERERLGEFNALKTILQEHKILTGELKESTEGLKNVLSNNQSRGKWGEEIADSLLKNIGFVSGEHYISNTAQETNSNRPDFTIFLPDKKKLNIDVKFPYAALVKFEETNDKKYLADFARDVKQKVKEVSSRDYINPEENTVDFVILFVPNERIFSYIYDKLGDVWKEALKKKVVIAGPFSFTAILRMVYQSYKSFMYYENLGEIINLIKVFEQEYDKFNQELDTLGSKLKTVNDQYDKVSVIRNKKLTRIVDKIKGESEEAKSISDQDALE
ncbi:MAG: DNA recombination protein RmuC [Candidatus Pacebacteria bacterium]|nr:DNA recombination protein RmuC [Candidatus Paceibacterota bacterium]